MATIDAVSTGDFLEADRAIARYFGVAEADRTAAAAALGDAFCSAWVPIAGVADQLRRLAATGVPLAIVSNASGTMEAELSSFGICAVGGRAAGRDVPEVAVVVDSCVVGVEKPDPAIFAFAMDVLDVPPERCLYVGDSVHFDVNGAAAAGLRPVHLTSMDCPGLHPHCRTLSEFVDDFLKGASASLTRSVTFGPRPPQGEPARLHLW